MALAVIGCHSTRDVRRQRPRQFVSDDTIRRVIVGTWQADAHSFAGRAVTFVFDPDGTFVSRGVAAENAELKHEARWRANQGFVILTPKKDELPSNSEQFIAIFRIDDHQLVCRPGLSVAGDPWRFTK